MKDLPSDDVILGLADPSPIVEEMLFRRFPMEMTPQDDNLNEQMRHRNAILKSSLDFPLLGVKPDKRTTDITNVAVSGVLSRAGQAEPGQQSGPQTARPQNGLPDPRALAEQSFSAPRTFVWTTCFPTSSKR